MKVELTTAEVHHLADLARIALSDDEVELFQKQLTEVIDYNASLLAELDVSSVEPTAQVTGLINVWGEDQVRPSLDVEVALSQAPRSQDDQFVVPQVLGS
jgi:aspartyl-tRNA(Asn)/glutamyl-tRNA(Gln) amidotransferase subunit C